MALTDKQEASARGADSSHAQDNSGILRLWYDQDRSAIKLLSSLVELLLPACGAGSARGRGLRMVTLCAAQHLDDASLPGVSALQRLHDQPGALVVLDVGADLADHLRVAKRVQVIVLDLRNQQLRPVRYCMCVEVMLIIQIQLLKAACRTLCQPRRRETSWPRRICQASETLVSRSAVRLMPGLRTMLTPSCVR